MQQLLDDYNNLGNIVKATVYNNMSSKQLGEKQQLVLNALRNNPDGLTDKGISVETGLSLSCVCGRRNELMDLGLVVPYTVITFMGEENIVSNIVWGVK